MSKSSRMVFLVVTVVLAIFVFSIIWTTRNTEETDLLKQARERQSTPLLIVDKPLNTNLAELSAEEKLANEIRALILNDEAFKTNLANALDISNDSVEDIAQNISEEIKIDVLAEVEKYKSEYDEKLAELAAREPVTQTITQEVNVDDLINQLIEPLTIKVYEQISSDQALKDSIINEAVAKVGAHIAREEVEAIVVDLYEDYQDEVITQIVSAVLSEIEKNAPIPAPEVLPPTVVDQTPKAPEVLPPTVVDQTPKAPEVLPPEVVENKTEEIIENVEAEAVQAAESDVDYHAKRTELREEAIREILDMIKNNN